MTASSAARRRGPSWIVRPLPCLAIQPLPVRSIQEIAAIPDPDERARELYFSNPDLDCPTVQALIASLVKTFHGAVLAQRLLPPPPKRVVRRRKRRVPPPPVQMPSLLTARRGMRRRLTGQPNPMRRAGRFVQ